MSFRRLTNELHAHCCFSCGGFFLPTEAVRKLSERFPEGLDNTMAFRARVEARKAEPMMTCPVCNHGMARVRSTVVDVDLDVCDLHGTFYDPGEIGMIARALRASGMYGGSPFDDLGAPPRAAVSGVARPAVRPLPGAPRRAIPGEAGAPVDTRAGLAELSPDVAAGLTAGTALDYARGTVDDVGEAAGDAAIEGALSALRLLDD